MPRHRRAVQLAVLIAGAFLATQARATTVQIAPSKDNTLYQQVSGTLSNGAGSFFFAGTSGANEIRRGLVAFDIAAAIPHGATIQSVTLTLHMSQTTTGAQSVSLRRVSADWGEGTSDAAGGEGGGAPSATNDATWIHRFFNTTLWSTVGGDFTGGTSATLSVVDTTFYSWSGAGLVADVQQMLDAPATNFGWILIGNEGLASTAKRFDSRQNAAAWLRPVLTVDYIRTVPGTPAAGVAMLSIGLAGLAVFALRRRSKVPAHSRGVTKLS